MPHRTAHRWFLKIADKDRQAWRQRPRLYRSNPVAVRAWHDVDTGKFRRISYLYMMAYAARSAKPAYCRITGI